MDESFPLRQMQKIKTSLGVDEVEEEVNPPESRESMLRRARVALDRLEELVASDPEVAAMAAEIRRQRSTESE